MKAIAIGGNRLSRGLTLEGLTVSYFVRRSVMYDTLMQMGRWFGFRRGYEDLTRIYTTVELEGWFHDLAGIEHRLREDISIYETQGLNPRQVGMRIWQHPVMQVTSRLKSRFASSTTIAQSYSQTLEQTFKFPLSKPDVLAVQAEHNRLAARDFVSSLGVVDTQHTDRKGPVWANVNVDFVLAFLREYRVDEELRSISLTLISQYIEKVRDIGELTQWTIAIRGRETPDANLGEADWASSGGIRVSQISRSRIGETNSLGVITSPGDEAIGLTSELLAQAQLLTQAAAADGRTMTLSSAARQVRPASNGVLLLYPISRYSGWPANNGGVRKPLYHDPSGPLSRNLVGIAISFPRSNQPQTVDAFVEGTVAWRQPE